MARPPLARPVQINPLESGIDGDERPIIRAVQGPLQGRVILALDGSVTARGPNGASVEAATDKVGLWKLGALRPGHWTIEVKQPGYLPTTREVDVPAATRAGTTTVRDVRIDLARGALVGGIVRDARGQRVAVAHVIVKSATATVEGDTDGQGEFRIHDAPTGDVSVQAQKGDANGSTHVTVRPGDEVLGLAVEIR